MQNTECANIDEALFVRSLPAVPVALSSTVLTNETA